jgi:hypothetical protein
MNAANAIAGRARVVGYCRVGPLGAVGKSCAPASLRTGHDFHIVAFARVVLTPASWRSAAIPVPPLAVKHAP